MAPGVTVVTGPARSGKTARLLARYREVLAESLPGRALWIAPTRRTAAELRGRLLTGELTACFSPGVVTFDEFADSILQAAPPEAVGGSLRYVTGSMQRRLVEGVIESARARGALKHFAPIANTNGLVDLVTDFIGELKRLEIWPDEFSQACGRRGRTAKDRELLALYEAYQHLLTEHRLYDREGRFWSARALLRDGQRRPYEQVSLLVVDGFTDFTRTQHEMLKILSDRVEQTIISLPLESAPRRDDLFSKTTETLRRLQKRHPGLEVEEMSRGPLRAGAGSEPVGANPFLRHGTEQLSAWPALAHIERELFKSPHEVRPLMAGAREDGRKTVDSTPGAERIEIVAASRQTGEVESVAGRIKELIVNDGVRADEIVVVYRSLSEVAPLVREVFTERGIRAAIEAREPLATAGAMRALMSLLRFVADDWPFRRLLSVISNNYFQPDWPEWHDGRAVVAAERLIRVLQVPSGRETLMSQVRRWTMPPAAEGNETSTGGDEAPTDDWAVQRRTWALLAEPLLSRLGEATRALPARATQSQWAAALGELATATGLIGAMRTAEDLAAWECLQETLADGDRLDQWLGRSPERITRDELLRLVSDVLRSETLPGDRDATGRVRVLSAASARTVNIGTLFFAGLSEKAFPPAYREDRLYSEADSRRLIEAGLPLVDRAERSREEMLLFYEVITRPVERLFLSYPALDERAQPLLPSAYLVEVERACGEGVIGRVEEPDLSPVPRSSEPASPGEFRVKAVAEALQPGGDVRLLAGLLQQEPTPGLARSLTSALRATHARQRGQGFGEWEGIVSSEIARQELAERYGSDHPWSPSRLEQYAGCPHQFFLERVLGLEPLDDLTLEIDHLRRGRLLHAALAVFHERLREIADVVQLPTDHDEDEFLREFAAVLDMVVEATPTAGNVDRALCELDRRQLAEWGHRYYEQHADYDRQSQALDDPLLPAHFEVRFGPARGVARDDEDRLSTDAPFAITVDGEKFLLTGRVDRIDLGKVAGRTIFNVVDYKSGKSGTLSDDAMTSGVALQLPLYAMAIEEMLLVESGAVPWQAGYWRISGSGFGKKSSLVMHEESAGEMQPTERWQALRPQVLARLRTLVGGIRNGEFPMQSADDNCTSICPFNTVCRVGQVRSLEKTWPAEAEKK